VSEITKHNDCQSVLQEVFFFSVIYKSYSNIPHELLFRFGGNREEASHMIGMTYGSNSHL